MVFINLAIKVLNSLLKSFFVKEKYLASWCGVLTLQPLVPKVGALPTQP
jgi:hypothetical protein